MPHAFAAHEEGQLYWAEATPANLSRCTATSCAAMTAAVTYVNASVAELVGDATGIYYLTTTGTIVTCPLAGCSGGARTLVTSLTGASNLRSQGNFVYWLVASPAGSPTGGVFRIAKP